MTEFAGMCLLLLGLAEEFGGYIAAFMCAVLSGVLYYRVQKERKEEEARILQDWHEQIQIHIIETQNEPQDR